MSKSHLIMSIDSGTQSCRAFVWDQYGNCLAEGRAEHSIDTPRLGWFEQDAGKRKYIFTPAVPGTYRCQPPAFGVQLVYRF